MSANENESAPVLTVNDLMARWKCTRKVVLAAIRTKRIHAFRPGGRVFRVTLDEVLRYERAEAA